MVIITGQVSRAAIGSDAFQETDIYGITLPIVKQNITFALAFIGILLIANFAGDITLPLGVIGHRKFWV